MKHLKIATLFAASTLLTVAGPINAAPNDAPHRNAAMHQQQGNIDLDRGPLSQLDLTEEQRAEIKDMMTAKREQRQNDRATKQADHQQMQEAIQSLMQGSTLDTEALETLADQHATNEKQRFIDRVQTQYEIQKVLTDEQQAKLEQIQADHQQHGPREHGPRDGKSANPHGRKGE